MVCACVCLCVSCKQKEDDSRSFLLHPTLHVHVISVHYSVDNYYPSGGLSLGRSRKRYKCIQKRIKSASQQSRAVHCIMSCVTNARFLSQGGIRHMLQVTVLDLILFSFVPNFAVARSGMAVNHHPLLTSLERSSIKVMFHVGYNLVHAPKRVYRRSFRVKTDRPSDTRRVSTAVCVREMLAIAASLICKSRA